MTLLAIERPVRTSVINGNSRELAERRVEQSLRGRGVQLEPAHGQLDGQAVAVREQHEALGRGCSGADQLGHETTVVVSLNHVSTTAHHVSWGGVVQEVA